MLKVNIILKEREEFYFKLYCGYPKIYHDFKEFTNLLQKLSFWRKTRISSATLVIISSVVGSEKRDVYDVKLMFYH